MSRGRRLLTLFFSMLTISTFTFGGGFVIVTLMKRRFVDELHWLDENPQVSQGPSERGAWRAGPLIGFLVLSCIFGRTAV